MNLLSLNAYIQSYLHSVKKFEISGLKKDIQTRKIDQKFWREAIKFWRMRIDETLQGGL